MIDESFFTINQHNHRLLNNKRSIIHNSIAIGSSNGTFGELLQGVLPNGDHFLVTFPIANYSKCIIIPDDQHATLDVYPSHKTKSLKLAEYLLQHYKIRLTGKIIIKSDLEEGKGLASSSADLIATAKALEHAINIKIDNDLLLNILRKIEPTDGVMYPGFVAFYHRKVELIEYLGNLPTMTVIAIDEGGEVNTIEYNKRSYAFTDDEKNQYQNLLNKLSLAVKQTDMKTIGRIATMSVMMHQKRCTKRYLDDVLRICEKINGLGVIAAHSGTYLGIILANHDDKYNEKLEYAIYELSKITCNFKLYESITFNSQTQQYNNYNNCVGIL